MQIACCEGYGVHGDAHSVSCTVGLPEVGAALKEIRRFGWSVAVHNDYRLNGERFTFWLFTRSGGSGEFDQAVKGEGRSDEVALNEILWHIGSPLAQKR